MENYILNVKRKHTSWGARKIREHLVLTGWRIGLDLNPRDPSISLPVIIVSIMQPMKTRFASRPATCHMGMPFDDEVGYRPSAYTTVTSSLRGIPKPAPMTEPAR